MRFKKFYEQDRTCPLDSIYGEMSTGGGYGSNTEYEIGAQSVAEAAHCILGSLVKIKRKVALAGLNAMDAARIERGHINEEFGIIRHAIQEYAKSLYIERIFKQGSELANECIKSIKENSPKLKSKAEEAKLRINVPSPLKEVAEFSYDVIINLADAMLNSVKDVPDGGKPSKNAFKDRNLIRSVNDLSNAISVLYPASEENV